MINFITFVKICTNYTLFFLMSYLRFVGHTNIYVHVTVLITDVKIDLIIILRVQQFVL